MTIPAARLSGNAISTREQRSPLTAWAVVLLLGIANPGLAAQVDPGRLFFTPAQRAQLEATRARNVTEPGPGHQAASDSAPAPLRYDGVVIRSDGKTTRWVDGKPQVGASRIQGLKPGQIRAEGKVYEPYQLLRPTAPTPAKPDIKDTVP